MEELPAGTLEPSESIEAAALRECHEEIGKIAGRAQKLLSLFPSPGFCDEEMNFFLLTDLRDRRPDEAEAHQDPDEILNVKEFPVSDVREMVKRGEIVDMNPTIGVWPRPGRADAVYRKLVTAHPRLSVYRRAETPAHWHYRDHERVPPIVAVADEGWSVMRRSSIVDAFARSVRRIGGNHGYDPRARSMHGLFVAAGPAFRSAAVVPPFENVHVYTAMCRILGVTPAPNDGNEAVAAKLLR